MTAKLPGSRAPLIPGAGPMAPEFYRYFAELDRQRVGNASAADVAAINARITALQASVNAIPDSQYPTLRVDAPLKATGLLQTGYMRLGWAGTTTDVPEGTNLYYTGARVYASLKSMLVQGSNVTLTPDDTAQTIRIAASATGGSARSLPQSWVFS